MSDYNNGGDDDYPLGGEDFDGQMEPAGVDPVSDDIRHVLETHFGRPLLSTARMSSNTTFRKWVWDAHKDRYGDMPDLKRAVITVAEQVHIGCPSFSISMEQILGYLKVRWMISGELDNKQKRMELAHVGGFPGLYARLWMYEYGHGRLLTIAKSGTAPFLKVYLEERDGEAVVAHRLAMRPNLKNLFIESPVKAGFRLRGSA